MRKGRRLATTAGATVLTFVALGGVAQADPLGDATGGLTDTLGGVVDSVTGGAVHLSTAPDSATQSTAKSTPTSRTTSKSTSRSSGGSDPALSVGVDGPVHANVQVRANSSPGNGTQANVSVGAGVRQPSGRGDLIGASVNVGVDTCGFAPEACGMVPPPVNPPGNPPGNPPSTPPGTGAPPAAPPGVTGPSGAGPSAPGAAASVPSSMKESLPFTGGPIGALAAIGLAAVVTGSAAVGASRLRLGRDPQ
jgi:hypothetical protein